MHARSVSEALKHFGVTFDGLSGAEAAQRRETFGPNRLRTKKPVSPWVIFLNQFKSFIIYLLLCAVVFSILIGEYTDSLLILVILCMNSLIGFFQELRANRALEALRDMARVKARVIREGVESVVDAEQLVPGDIIRLESGDKVPADCRMVRCNQLQAEESVLTGESFGVNKVCDALAPDLQLAERSNMVFSSTAIVRGRGVAVVTHVGMSTEIGKISRMMEETQEGQTPLQRRLDRFGRRLGTVIIIICILVFLLLLWRVRANGEYLSGKIFIEFAFVAISLAVAAVPTALPAVVTIALSIGTKRLLHQQMLVRRLTSVETLGSCDVICSDKTGTLTGNIMTVGKGWTANGEITLPPANGLEELSFEERKLFEIGAGCNNARFLDTGGEVQQHGSPTERAMLTAAGNMDISFAGERLAELPFDGARKCMSVLVRVGDGFFVYAKGAPGRIIKQCSTIAQDGQLLPLGEKEQAEINRAVSSFASQAMRVVACAYRRATDKEDLVEENLVFVGLQAMNDPPRKEVGSAIMKAREAHIRPIMITGDNKETAKAIGKRIGIIGAVLTGRELDSMDDSAFAKAVGETDIYARVVPEQKLRIVKVLQQKGHVVAMTGDGVNDAPALKKADLGIAVGSGTEVAKEAADFVLLNDSFANIIDGVEEGRGIYDNIQKSIMLLLSGNLMEVLLVFSAVLLGYNLPLTALLLLWINLITDGAPALAYSVDPYGNDIMQRKPVSLQEGILPKTKMRLLLMLGAIGALLGLYFFSVTGGNSSHTPDVIKARTQVFTYIVLCEMLLVFVIRKSYSVRLFTNRWLWAAVTGSLLLHCVILYTPLCTIFGLVPLTGQDFLAQGVVLLVFGCCCMLSMHAGFIGRCLRRRF